RHTRFSRDWSSDVCSSDLELGAMARAVEVFRENGRRVHQLTEAEAAQALASQEARARMMTTLQRAFGDVVDAAVAGDFSKRVERSEERRVGKESSSRWSAV